ncbi:MAG: YihA family ribosome biogenesis GTP-binding protein [Desulfovibrio sp.]|nr:YihA family ribosome biogenesis GTP-binding protein [Desulfovibrio sp.]
MVLSASLAVTAYIPQQLVKNAMRKVVFAGRSNVGKSSLLNALFGQKLAKVSGRPGKTQSVNYYLAQAYNFYLVDLPGYGYAQANHSQRSAWGKLIEVFFDDVEQLKAVFVLLDSRLEPQDKDLEMIAYARERGFTVQGILTKADKCSRQQLTERLAIWSAILPEPPLITSAKSKQGLSELRRLILSRVGEE